MPGYGVLPADQGTGLLPWSWAQERLGAARNYWVATLWPDGRPHLSAVWGGWHADAVWFTCSARSRKARNLAADPRCTMSTEDSADPVVVEGLAEVVRDLDTIRALVDVLNAKYGPTYSVEFLDPASNATVRVRPQRAYGLEHDDFTGSPTRWTFPD